MIFIFIFIFVFHEIYIVVSVDALFFFFFFCLTFSLKKKSILSYIHKINYSTNGLISNIELINFYNIFF